MQPIELANGIIEELNRGKANLLRLSGLMIKRLKIKTIQRMEQNNKKSPVLTGLLQLSSLAVKVTTEVI
jgi:cobalamin-dependent methionine synthase I